MAQYVNFQVISSLNFHPLPDMQTLWAMRLHLWSWRDVFFSFLKSLFENLGFSEISLCFCILQTIVLEQILHHAGSTHARQVLNAFERMWWLLAVASEVSSAYPSHYGTGGAQNWLSKPTKSPGKRLIFVFTWEFQSTVRPCWLWGDIDPVATL